MTVPHSGSDPAPVFHSALLAAIERGQGAPRTGTAAQWQGWLDGAQRRGEFRKAERDWLGVDDWLAGQSAGIAREDLGEFVRGHQVQLQDTLLGGAASGFDVRRSPTQGGWQVRDPNGQWWGGYTSEDEALRAAHGQGSVRFGRFTLTGKDELRPHYRELLLTLPPAASSVATANSTPDGANFLTGHFPGIANILAHVRFDERTDATGERVLFIEEIQSDWHQQGRKHGYQALDRVEQARKSALDATPFAQWSEQDVEWYNRRVHDARQYGVPDAPLKAVDEWATLAFKRMVRWAAENGFDRIAWTTGAQQVARYDLSQHVKSIGYLAKTEGRYDVQVRAREDRGGQTDVLWSGQDVTLPEIEQHVGKEIAERIQAGTGFKHRGRTYLEGLDLQVGGEGMRAFYDTILPAAVNKWARKFAGAVAPMRVNVGEQDADTFEVVLPNGKVVHSSDSRKQAAATAACFEGATVRAIDLCEPVHGLVVTPAMREAALAGLPLFKRETALTEEPEDDDDRPACRF